MYVRDREPGSSVISVWSVDKFERRLEVMRDLYSEVNETQREWNPAEGDPDPWADGDKVGSSRVDRLGLLSIEDIKPDMENASPDMENVSPDKENAGPDMENAGPD